MDTPTYDRSGERTLWAVSRYLRVGRADRGGHPNNSFAKHQGWPLVTDAVLLELTAKQDDATLRNVRNLGKAGVAWLRQLAPRNMTGTCSGCGRRLSTVVDGVTFELVVRINDAAPSEPITVTVRDHDRVTVLQDVAAYFKASGEPIPLVNGVGS